MAADVYVLEHGDGAARELYSERGRERKTRSRDSDEGVDAKR